EEDALPHRPRILDVLEAEGCRRPLVMAEIGFTGAGRDDQVVVRDLMFADHHRAARGADGGYRPQHYARVALPARDRADRRRNIGRRQSSRRDLIEQGLEKVMVMAVDDRHVGLGAAETGCCRQPAKPRANNHDPWTPGRCDNPCTAAAVDLSVHGDTSAWPVYRWLAAALRLKASGRFTSAMHPQ